MPKETILINLKPIYMFVDRVRLEYVRFFELNILISNKNTCLLCYITARKKRVSKIYKNHIRVNVYKHFSDDDGEGEQNAFASKSNFFLVPFCCRFFFCSLYRRINFFQDMEAMEAATYKV